VRGKDYRLKNLLCIVYAVIVLEIGKCRYLEVGNVLCYAGEKQSYLLIGQDKIFTVMSRLTNGNATSTHIS
jgi:hypothetical protein